jgi:hypothetical protein
VILRFLKDRMGILAFGFAALAAPLAMLVPTSCGAACAGCPLAGGCIVVPVVAVGIGASGLMMRIRVFLDRLQRNTG